MKGVLTNALFAVGLFSCDKFEETPKQKVIDQQSEFYNPIYIAFTNKPRCISFGFIFVDKIFNKMSKSAFF